MRRLQSSREPMLIWESYTMKLGGRKVSLRWYLRVRISDFRCCDEQCISHSQYNLLLTPCPHAIFRGYPRGTSNTTDRAEKLVRLLKMGHSLWKDGISRIITLYRLSATVSDASLSFRNIPQILIRICISAGCSAHAIDFWDSAPSYALE